MLRPKIFSSISKLQLIFNFLLSLMLRSKIFSSSFQHQPFYAQRSSPLSNVVDATLSDTLFTFQTSSMLRSKISFVFFSHSTRIDAMFFDFISMFLPLYHHWCYALRTSLQFSNMFDVTSKSLRYSLQLSNILEATFQDLYFKFETSVMLRAKIFSSNFPTSLTRLSKIFFSMFWHHQCCALRSSFQVLNITDPLLDDLLFNFLQ